MKHIKLTSCIIEYIILLIFLQDVTSLCLDLASFRWVSHVCDEGTAPVGFNSVLHCSKLPFVSTALGATFLWLYFYLESRKAGEEQSTGDSFPLCNFITCICPNLGNVTETKGVPAPGSPPSAGGSILPTVTPTTVGMTKVSIFSAVHAHCSMNPSLTLTVTDVSNFWKCSFSMLLNVCLCE